MIESFSGETSPGEIETLLTGLTRAPDFDAPELRAYDAADVLALEQLVTLMGSLSESDRSAALARLVVITDRHGALTLGATQLTGARGIRVHQDGVLGERALAANAMRLGLTGRYQHHALSEALLSEARIVLMQLPRSLAELDEISWNIARWASPDVVVLAGGRDKHMSRNMNEVLSQAFDEVTASRGWRKARVLTARQPKPVGVLGEPPFPVHARDADLNFELYAFGATFGGADLDHGSRLLLQTLREVHPSPNTSRGANVAPLRVVDLGCGNGVLATAAAQMWPAAQIIATDQSAAAVAATHLTAQHAGVHDRIEVHRADATEAVPDGWADLVLLNPPFHTGSTVHAGVAHRLIESAARALAPGGELRLVFNSHLGYRPLVERVIGPTRQLARNRTFTVLAASRG